jgi:lysophospholipase L1-like esterase
LALVGKVAAIGDSVMLGAESTLGASSGGTVVVDATVARQFRTAPQVVADARSRGATRFVLHLGTNGPLTDAQFDAVVAEMGTPERVVVVTVHLPELPQYTHRHGTNDVLRRGAERWGISLVDWDALASTTPGLVGDDGYHLTPSGARAYTDLVLAALGP